MTISQLQDEKELLQLIAEGDKNAFRQLHDEYWESLYPVALGFLKSPDLAMDALQEVFMRLWNNRRNLTEVKTLRAYIYTAVQNEVLSYLKKELRRQGHYNIYNSQIHKEAPQSDDKIRIAQAREMMEKAIAQLPALQRDVLQLSRFEALSHAEIASRLQIDKKAVTNAITRALNNIRGYLKQHGEDGLTALMLLLAELLR